MQRHIEKFPEIEERTLVMRCKQTGALVGLLPLIARKKLAVTILEYANMGLVDYAMPILHRDIDNWIDDPAAISRQLLKKLGRYDILRIKHMPTDNPAILKLFPNAHMQVSDFSAHAVDLGTDYDAWRAANVSKNERKHRDRKRRTLERDGGWEMKVLSEPDEVAIAMDHLRAFHKDRYKDRPGEDLIQDPQIFEFYRQLAVEDAGKQYVCLCQFTLNDQIVAVEYGLKHDGRYLMLMMGFDLERAGRYSPGLLMTEDIIANCIKFDIGVFDFTVGDEAYKLKFGTRPIPIYTLWHTHSLLGSVGLSVAEAVRRTPMKGRLRRWVS
ncbi:GNAT family N-acetyltransferase [uncultured Cohaesibacter sp.]|uniref:GNAT family N-acetyltransferase n=1 Tax=uncultured Cohaesibacter sp. TaxID=1002546 RepID=UPI00292D82D3|nr:GNAT family N-acetyltransferase [uncultured Cohaesibacter sp.]